MKLLPTFDKDKCSACGACAIACMDQNDIDVENGQQPYRKVYQYESRGGEMVCMSVACRHCADAPCVKVCPAGCLYKDGKTGLTLYNNENCIGCHSCAIACPYGAPSFRPYTDREHIHSRMQERKRVRMEKCDGCVERVTVGLLPACVHTCPTGALTACCGEDM